MNNFRLLILLLFLTLTPNVYSNEKISSHVNAVELFVAAFNAQDSAAMASFVTNDIQWLSVDNNQVAVEAKGKSNLIDSMDAYFKSCPTCRSEVTEMISTTSRVSAVEIASWHGKSGHTAQKAISVYEFTDGLISRVYYFPAEK